MPEAARTAPSHLHRSHDSAAQEFRERGERHWSLLSLIVDVPNWISGDVPMFIQCFLY